MTNQNQSTQSGAFSTLGSTGKQHNYNTPAVQIGNAIRDGDEFVLLVRSRQSDGFQVWSSGDEQVTEQLYKQAAPTVAMKEPTTT
jgi:hypothetical protein